MSRRGIWPSAGSRCGSRRWPNPQATRRNGRGGNGTVRSRRSTTAAPAPLLIDCLFGTGLKKPLDEAVSEQLLRLGGAVARAPSPATCRAAPTATAAPCSRPCPISTMTVTFGALKPAHRLAPAMRSNAAGSSSPTSASSAESDWHEIGRARTAAARSRRATNMTAGWSIASPAQMPGAIALAASAAARTGAGYVRVSTSRSDRRPAVRHRPDRDGEINDPRIGCDPGRARAWATSRRC